MPSKSVSLKLSSNDPWSTNISQQAIEQIKDYIKNDYKTLDPIGKGSFAQVFGATRIKNSIEKPVAVRIVVTNNQTTFKQEKRSTKFFKNLKNTKSVKEKLQAFMSEDSADKPKPSAEGSKGTTVQKQKPEYYKYINVPKLKYEISFMSPDSSDEGEKAYGLVFESERADRDVWSNTPTDEYLQEHRKETTIPDDALKYLPKMISDIAQSLNVLHSAKKIHSDLKPDNILVKNDGTEKISFQLTDFGMCWTVKAFEKIDKEKVKIADEKEFESWIEEILTFFRGTKFSKRTQQNDYFAAPEKNDTRKLLTALRLKKRQKAYNLSKIDDFITDYNKVIDMLNTIGPKSDMFSFGKTIEVIAMALANSKGMYDRQWSYGSSLDEASKRYKGLAANKFTPRAGKTKDTQLKNLINKLTDDDITKRPSALQVLSDPYLK